MPFLWILLPLLWLGQGNVPANDLRDLRLRVVEEINRDRQAAGLQPVEFSDELSRAADAHCKEMLRDGYANHWNRAGWKPYMRYSFAGIHDFTSENVWSLWSTGLDTSPESVQREILAGHRSFMSERPPYDGHRRSILSPRQARVGIGLAFDRQGIRLIEVFGMRFADLQPLPLRATLRDDLTIEGRITNPTVKLFGVAIYYEPLPQTMYLQDLKEAHSYGLPEEHLMERVRLEDSLYSDGSEGTIHSDGAGHFSVPLKFWKKMPGVYTVGVWVREGNSDRAFLGAMTSVFVEEPAKGSR
jgi:uncharacterized protein YkwD